MKWLEQNAVPQQRKLAECVHGLTEKLQPWGKLRATSKRADATTVLELRATAKQAEATAVLELRV